MNTLPITPLKTILYKNRGGGGDPAEGKKNESPTILADAKDRRAPTNQLLVMETGPVLSVGVDHHPTGQHTHSGELACWLHLRRVIHPQLGHH
jgi:hypothetical protein